MPHSPRVAFYAPMKPPDHPNPSGDRQIARLTLRALELAGFAPFLVSDLRTLDMVGDKSEQTALMGRAEGECARIIESLRINHVDLWFTYHSYHKAPDLLGPIITRALEIPYAISEPSVSPRRREGPWAAFAMASEHAIATADALFWTTSRDLPALEAAGHAGKMHHLPAFVDPGDPPPQKQRSGSLHLLTVAMMRPGDKVESYRRLAAGLAALDMDWHLTVVGDGEARAHVTELLNPFGTNVTFSGAMYDSTAIRTAMETADLFLWPGVNEGVGMVWLEAQAAGLPVIAEDHPAARALVANRLAPPDNSQAFAELIFQTAEDLPARAMAARSHVVEQHSLDSAAATLREALTELIR